MTKEAAKIKRKIYSTLVRYGVSKAALFGSIARGENKEDSDIDILVNFKGAKSLLDLAGLKIELENILKKEVDVLTYNSLHPLIKKQILQEQEVIL